MRVRSRPTPLPGESLPSILGRFAVANHVPARQVFGLPLAESLLRARTLSKQDRADLAETLGLDDTQWHACVYEPEADSALGDLDTGAGTWDPLGWALTHHSTRCLSCHHRGDPWMLQHQTGLAWICPRHQTYLQAVCGACTSRAASLAGAPLTCRHHSTPASVLTDDPEAVLAIQERLLLALHHPPTTLATPPLRDLRAATVFALLDAALSGRSPHLSTDAVREARARCARRDGRGGRLGLRLGRPPHEPWLNAHLTSTALRHWDARTGSFDEGWLSAVAHDVRQSAIPTRHLLPFAAQLDIEIPGSKTHMPVAHRWLRLAERLSHRLTEHGFGADAIPAALTDPGQEDLWTSEWPLSLARAALLYTSLTDSSLTDAVCGLGHHFTHVTPVKQILSVQPTTHDTRAFEAAVDTLLSDEPRDLANARRWQRNVTNVDRTVLRQHRVTPPTTARLHAGQVAAAWLWCVSTGGHLTSVPFLDGRATHPLAGRIRDWHRSHGADLIALLEWNDRLRDANTGANKGRVPRETITRAAG